VGSSPTPHPKKGIMKKPIELCPGCGVNLTGEPIPKDIREYYSKPWYFSRKIGITDRKLDRVTTWRCPDCGHEWERK
jgi:predicted RNA-binding Zn-ribbon protein involved in translation (DUF1610 family)